MLRSTQPTEAAGMRPSEEQIDTALDTAERMWARGLDPHHLARVVRYLHERNAILEEILRRIDHMLRYGMSEQETTRLRRMVSRLRDEDLREEPDSEINSSMLL